MSKRVKTCLSLFFILCSFPYLIYCIIGQGQQDVVEQQGEQQAIMKMVAEAIPMDSEQEAIKAQVVLERTECVRQWEQTGEWPEGFSKDDLKEFWGVENYKSYYKKLQNCIDETTGIILTCGGKCIQATYHAISSGKTRDASGDVLDGNYAYLQSVDSMDDAMADNFLQITYVSKDELMEKLKLSGIEIQLDEKELETSIEVVKRDVAGYVLTLSINGITVGGETFREVLDLPSACYYLEWKDQKLRIVTKGLGHGFGMSQYGANEMAKKGKSFQEILTYYFYNVQLKEE